MICDAEDIAKIAQAIADRGFTKAQLEKIAELIAAAIDKHLDEYKHTETPLSQGEREED